MFSYVGHFIYNLSFLVAMSIISGFIWQGRKREWEEVLQGLLFGTAVVLGMMHPLVLQNGLIFDGRSVMISLCGLFFGPIALGVAAGIALSYRLLVVGGSFILTGELVIAWSALVGLVLHYHWIRKGKTPTTGGLLGVGVLVHAGMILLMFTLPGGRGLWTVTRIGMPVLLTFPLATLLIGKVLLSRTTELRSMEALAKSRAELRTLIDTIPDLIWFKDKDGKYLACNARFERFFGAREQEIVGMTDADFVGREQADAFRQADRKAMAAGGPTTNEEHISFADDGHEEYLETIKTPTFGPNGKILGVLGIGRNITERKAAEARILGMNQELEQRVKERTAELEAANQELEAFSYSVSHDLRAPLRGIDGFSLVIMEEYASQLDEAGRHYLSRIRLGTQRMGQLIDDLLALARTSRSELVLADCDLSAICHRIARDLAAAHPGRQVQVTIQPGLQAWADPGLMQVVLENLLGNAWKFTARSAEARIQVERRISPGGERTFCVQDSGAGFEMAHSQKLFNAFQRLHPAAEFEGNGIGLASVRRIIHRHRGRIWAEGEPGKGAAFFFTLPDPTRA
jgi:PAS domain S-box-containing protein